MFTYWRDIFSCLLIEFTRNSVYFMIKITFKPPDVYDNQLNRCAIFWLTLQKSKTCRNHMIFVIIMFDFMKKKHKHANKKKRENYDDYFFQSLNSQFCCLQIIYWYIDRAKACFVFNWWKIYTLKKLNKSNFRIFFKKTQIYLCHQRWQMSLKNYT